MAQYSPQVICYWEKQFSRKIVKVEVITEYRYIYSYALFLKLRDFYLRKNSRSHDQVSLIKKDR